MPGKPLVRLVEAPPGDLLARLAAHVQPLVEAGRSVLIVSVQDTSAVLLSRLAAAGVDTKRVFVVDAAPGTDPNRPVDPDHEMALPSPMLLELIALRADRVIRLKAQDRAHVIVHTCNAFAAYNPGNVLAELVRYVVFQLARPRATIDFVVEQGRPLPKELADELAAVADERHALGAAPVPPRRD